MRGDVWGKIKREVRRRLLDLVFRLGLLSESPRIVGGFFCII